MGDPTSDAEETDRLLRQVEAGDRAALNRLLEQHRAYLLQFVNLHLDARLRPRVDPSDVVQEAQLEAARRLTDYLQQPPMPFRLWLRQLAQDRLLMTHRYHLGTARRAVQREVLLPEQSSLLLGQQLLTGRSTLSQELARRELARRVRQAMDELAAADREILLMRSFEGLSFEEVGYVLQIEPAAARKRHGRAILRLHKLLTDGGLTESQL